MFKRLYTKFMSLSPFLKVVATLLSIFGVIGGGYVIKEISFFQTIVNNNYNYPEKEITEGSKIDNAPKENVHGVNKKTPIKTKSSTTKTNTSLVNEKKTVSIFSQHPLKNVSKQTISFFITKNGGIDSKTTRAVASSIKRLNFDVPSLFNKTTLNYFSDFISPSESFLKYHQVNEYLDYYFICDITPLDTKKTSGMNTYTSALNIEGYLINTKTKSTKPFPYRNIKGAGFSDNDANLNLTQDLEEKIVNFIKVNI